MVWLLVEIAGRFATWVAGLFRRDLENAEWERGSRADRLPALGHDLDGGADPPSGQPRSPGSSE